MSVSKSVPARASLLRLGGTRAAAMGTLLPLIGGFALLVALAAGLIWLFTINHRTTAAIDHTQQMRTKVYRLLTLVQDAETGQRGYLLADDRDYLAPFKDAATQTPAALADLQAMVAGNAAQSASVEQLKGLIQAKFAELQATIDRAEKGDIPGALKLVRSNKGNHLMARIRDAVGRFEEDQQRSLRTQIDDTDGYNRWLEIAGLASIVLVSLLAAYAIRTTSRAAGDLLQAQASLRDTNENLESLVAERVAELQAANDEIQRFAYIVSHDLRAPLVNVMGFTSELEAIRDDVGAFLKDVETTAPALLTPDRRMALETDLPEALSFIRTSTAKMDRLINAILKLSREGRRVLTPQQIELRDLVRAQGESLSQQLESGNATLSVQDDLPDIVSDKLAMEQIFGNLIENAVKYLSPGRPGHIEVSGRPHGAYVIYEIKDNGRGIEAKDFERIFELFRRSGEQDKPGEGIGLAYVRNLARRLGGNVAVRSEFGKGSTFIVTLPAVFNAKARAA